MKILTGRIPEGKLWRSLILFGPDEVPGLAWQLGIQLAEANSGEVVAVVLVPQQPDPARLATIHDTLELIVSHAPETLTVYPLLIEALDFEEALITLVQQASIDILLADEDTPHWQELRRLPSHVAVVRGTAYHAYHQEHEVALRDGVEEMSPIRRILVPTAGGPNTAVALSFLVPLAEDVEVTMLYVVPDYLGQTEVAHGEAKLRRLAKFTDAGERVEQKVIRAESVTRGIVEEASGPYDLVIIGATRQSSLDRVLFGDVIGAVVRESKTPVAVVREASSTLGSMARNLAWRMQNVIPRLTLTERIEVYVRIRRSARPDIDFFVLIGLSALISALGLLLSSPAVVIGAMLVAPLMSPMVGAGLAVVLGNTRFLRLTLSAIARGAVLAIVLSMLTGVIRPDQALTPEILVRTQPTLLDLGVALFAGLAGAYALAHSEAAAALPGVAISAALVPPLSTIGIAFATGHFPEALGAMLLFSTNLVAIVAAAVFTFLLLGFRPTRAQKEERAVQMRSVRVALVMLAAITLILGVSTYQLARESQLGTAIRDVTRTHVDALEGVEYVALEDNLLMNPDEPLFIDVTVRSTGPISYSTAEQLRDAIAADLGPLLTDGREVALTLTVIRVTRIDPQAPPPEEEISSSLCPLSQLC